MATHSLLVTSPSGQLQRFRVSKPEITLGRAVLNDIVIADHTVSRTHARLQFDEQGVLLEDLASVNGTLLNGARVTSSRLSAADVVTIGDHTVRLTIDVDEPDFDRTQVTSVAELNATMAVHPFESLVNDTSLPRLAITTPGRTWEVTLQPDVTVIGRASECDLVIESVQVSRRHVQIEQEHVGFRVRDLGSRNGTWMAGRQIKAERLRDGDTFTVGEARCVFKAGFSSEELTTAVPPTSKGQRRPVVVVPGVMGSNLFLENTQVWPNVRLMLTDPDIFRYPGRVKLEPRGLVSEIVVIPNLIKQDQYNRLTEFLSEGLSYERGTDLMEFAYDWRQDVRISARELGAAIERWDIRRPVTIIAHSMGSLVSRYYVDCLGGRTRVERIVFLGAPHYGVPKSVVVMLQGPGLFPFGILNEKGREILTTFPSAHQILPAYPSVKDHRGNDIDVLADDRWVLDHQKACHALARDFWRELPGRCSVSTISIFGYGLDTVTGVTMTRDTEGRCRGVDLVSEQVGDNDVPQAMAILPGAEIHPVRQHHGALYTDKDVQMRLKLELGGS
jgi:pSer/pThr/pTyr-binding forkhead associated (FHA) protein/pimeloyl-ACP methyl ester carboxylesterase